MSRRSLARLPKCPVCQFGIVGVWYVAVQQVSDHSLNPEAKCPVCQFGIVGLGIVGMLQCSKLVITHIGQTVCVRMLT